MEDKNVIVQRWMRRCVGALVFTTGFLGYMHSPYWLFGTMFIGLNLVQFSFTNWCPLEILIRKVVERT